MNVIKDILSILNEYYSIHFDRNEMMRDAGSVSYMYDPTLICNKTHYFDFDECGYEKSKRILSRFLPEYLKYNALSQKEINAFYDLIALYHFALQATVIENYGLDCVDNAFLDKQLDWLYRWREQCEKARDING